MKAQEVRITLSDGCQLAADIYLPAEDSEPQSVQKFPVILAQTPYGKGGLAVLADHIVRAGYVLVLVDVRGRYNSEGEFNFVTQEEEDGPEIVAWITEQDWYDEKAGIGLLGISYLLTAGLSAAARCEAVKTLVNVGGVADFYQLSYRGGALTLHHALPWCIIVSYSPQPDLGEINWSRVLRKLPLQECAAEAGYPSEIWRDICQHPFRDQFWESKDLSSYLTDIDLPALHFSGWYDITLGTTLEIFQALEQHSSREQHLYLGPWSHNGILTDQVCLPEEQQQPAGSGINPAARIMAWFDLWLKGEEDKQDIFCQDDAINLYDTGREEWIKAQQWPPADCRNERLYLAAEGVLQKEKSEAEKTLSFNHDPRNPVPVLGGSVWEFPQAGLMPGPEDQQPLLEREDVIFFAAQELESEVTLVGPVRLKLFGNLSAETGDWVVRLMDITPEGKSIWLADGILRSPFRTGTSDINPPEPGKTTEYLIELQPLCHTLKSGHRLGIAISGSAFPKWDRNLHEIDRQFNSLTAESNLERCLQTIFLGGKYSSCLEFRARNQ